MMYICIECFASVIGTGKLCKKGKLAHQFVELKVVLEVKSETQLRNLSAKLTDSGIQHKLWIEQPEDFVTSLATKPYPKSEVFNYFKKLKLCKGS